jgi:Family of unknown function (DUF6188)
VAGFTVTSLRLDMELSLVIEGDEPGDYHVSVGQPFSFRPPRAGAELVLEPGGDPAEMAPALSVLRQDVERMVVFNDGRLELAFRDGSVLRVPLAEDYEAWAMSGADGTEIVSLPGGGLAIWRGDLDAGGTR